MCVRVREVCVWCVCGVCAIGIVDQQGRMPYYVLYTVCTQYRCICMCVRVRARVRVRVRE